MDRKTRQQKLENFLDEFGLTQGRLAEDLCVKFGKCVRSAKELAIDCTRQESSTAVRMDASRCGYEKHLEEEALDRDMLRLPSKALRAIFFRVEVEGQGVRKKKYRRPSPLCSASYSASHCHILVQELFRTILVVIHCHQYVVRAWCRCVVLQLVVHGWMLQGSG